MSLVSFSLREGSVQESTFFVSLTPPPQGLGILWTPLVGEPGFTVRKKVWPHAPGVGTSPAGETSTGEPAEGCSPQSPGPSASPRQAGWHPCCSHCSVTRPWVGHGRREQNMFWVAVHLPGGRVCRQASHRVDAGCQRCPWVGSRPQQGSSQLQLPLWDPRPSASQCLPTPSFQHRCLSQSFMGSGGPEFRSRFPPLVSCVVLDKSLLLSKLPFPYL